MPQLDVLTFSSQLVWLALSFLALYLILSQKVLPKIAATLAERKATLDETINKASLYRDEAEKLLADYEGALGAARAEAQKKITTALHAFSTDLAQRKHAHLEGVALQLRLEEEKLQKARREINGEVQFMAAGAAQAILEKFTHQSYAIKDLQK